MLQRSDKESLGYMGRWDHVPRSKNRFAIIKLNVLTGLEENRRMTDHANLFLSLK